MMKEFIVRDATLNDFDQIKHLNDDFVDFTSPMDLAKIEQLHNQSGYHKVIQSCSNDNAHDAKISGFLLAFAPSADYQSENYVWFDQRYRNFMYVDRIVVDRTKQGAGLGKRLYDDLFNFARKRKIAHICCEYNLIPANPISAAFHSTYGFQQVGQLSNEAQTKIVSMQIANAM